MEIHPRTLAATFRDMARERDAQAKGEHPGSAMLHHLYGEGDGLRAAAEHLEKMADDEFDRIIAESERLRGERPSELAARLADEAERTLGNGS